MEILSVYDSAFKPYGRVVEVMGAAHAAGRQR